jgi:hypothetical protein
VAVLIFPHRWRQQPTSPVGIDWSHPLAQGLRNFFYPSYGFIDAAKSGVLGAPTSITKSQNFWQFSGSPSEIRLGTAEGRLNRNFSVFSLCQLNTLAGDYAIASAGASGWLLRFANANLQFLESNVAVVLTDPVQVLPIGVPYSVGFTMSSGSTGTVRIYSSGRERVNGTTTRTFNDSTQELSIGTDRAGGTAYNHLPGLIGFVGIWERELSAAEATELHVNPWQLLKPQTRRIYVPSAATGGAITGTSDVTLDALTSAATGALAISGTASVTLAALTSTATGALAIAGALAKTLDDATLASTGSLLSAGTGTAAITLGSLTASATGSLAIAGAAAITLGAATVSAAGILSAPDARVGTASVTLANVTAAAAGTLAITGSSAVTLGSVTSAATGSVAIKGIAGISLGSLTLAASAMEITSDTRVGTASITLADLQLETMTAPLLARLGNRRLREGALRITKGALPTGRVKRGGLPRIS